MGLFVEQAGRGERMGPVRKTLTEARGEGQRAGAGVENAGDSFPLRPLKY